MRKRISILLAAFMVCSVCGALAVPSLGLPKPPESYEVAAAREFLDLEGYEWAEPSVYILSLHGIVNGAGPQQFNPAGLVSRAELIKLTVEAFDIPAAEGTSAFSDVTADAWYYPYVLRAEKAGLLNDIYSGTFGADTPATREELAAVAQRGAQAAGLTVTAKSEKQEFADADQISPFAQAAVETLQRGGIISGVSETVFAPEDHATRAAAAKIIYGLYKIKYQSTGLRPEAGAYDAPKPIEKNYELPEYLTPVRDTAMEGMQITRITDQEAFGREDKQYIRHHYPKDQPWNCDGTILRLKNDWMPLLDGKTYKVLGSSGKFASSDTVWSNTNPILSYGVDRPNQFVEVNMVTGKHKVRFTFDGYTNMTMGNYEGNLSADDRYAAFYGRTSEESSDLEVFVFDIQENKIVSQKTFPGQYEKIDWVTVTSSGQYVLINWSDDGVGSMLGVEQYDMQMNFVRQVFRLGSHGDVGFDPDGNELWVCLDYDDKKVVAFRLDNGQERVILDDPKNGIGHVSCRNLDRPGWAYITLNEADVNEVLGVKLDGSQTVERFAQIHSTPKIGYDAEAHGVVNRDGTKMIFASDWDGGSAAPVYSYVSEVAGSGDLPELEKKPEEEEKPIPDPPAAPKVEPGIVVPLSGLGVRLCFDEELGMELKDQSGNANTAYLDADPAAPQRAAGRDGGSLKFDGVDDRATVRKNDSHYGADGFTLAAWVCWYPNKVDGGVITKSDAFQLKIKPEGNVAVTYRTTNPEPKGLFIPDVVSGAKLTEGEWHHIAAVYSKEEAKMRIYIDGGLDTEQDVQADTVRYVASSDIYIGRYYEGMPFKGYIDDVFVYTKPLGGCDVARLMRANAKTKLR